MLKAGKRNAERSKMMIKGRVMKNLGGFKEMNDSLYMA